MKTGVGLEKMRLSTFDGSSPYTPSIDAKTAKIFYTSRVIANFVPNFVVMATGFNGGLPR